VTCHRFGQSAAKAAHSKEMPDLSQTKSSMKFYPAEASVVGYGPRKSRACWDSSRYTCFSIRTMCALILSIVPLRDCVTWRASAVGERN
jgi:hypothetical protein